MIIEGYLDENNQPRIRVIATGIRMETSLDAIIDTGFDGHLCLPVQIDCYSSGIGIVWRPS